MRHSKKSLLNRAKYFGDSVVSVVGCWIRSLGELPFAFNVFFILELSKETTKVATFYFLNVVNFSEFEILLLLRKRIPLKRK